MLKLCLVFWKSEPQYAYKRYAYMLMLIKKYMYACKHVLKAIWLLKGKFDIPQFINCRMFETQQNFYKNSTNLFST